MPLDQEYINSKIIQNDSLFNFVHAYGGYFDIIPTDNKHYGTYIKYQDLQILSEDFLNELYDSIIGWVYSSEKYQILLQAAKSAGKDEAAAASQVQRKARNKFRKNKNGENLRIQGQLGELLLYHYIQRHFKAIPLLRKMPITTSTGLERFGADAIHFKYEEKKPIFILGEAKTYTSKHKFSIAFKDALDSIIKTYSNIRKEMNLYLHEDFLDDQMNQIAEQFINNQLKNIEIRLVMIIVYNETNELTSAKQDEIHANIESIIEARLKNYDNKKINIKDNPILGRISYIVFPVWGLDKLAQQFQEMVN